MKKNFLDNSVLHKLWLQALHGNGQVATPDEWNEQLNAIYKSGKGLEETLGFLFHKKPSLENFIEWMKPAESYISTEQFVENTLTEQDIDFFNENGFVLIPDVITCKECEDARKAIAEYIGVDMNKATTWYKNHEKLSGLMVMFYHHPSLEVVRNSTRLRRAFEQLYATKKIHQVIDKVSFNPPETSFFTFKGSPLHWDVSLMPPIPFKLQGLLYLNDVNEDGGAFHCVPGFHKKVEHWLKQLPSTVNPRDEALIQLTPEPVTGKAGDFIVWHQALPHCASPNRSNTPRFVQYHTYDPDDLVTAPTWK